LELPGRIRVEGVKTQEGYTAHELDEETVMNYAGARYYDPAIGRFTTLDRFKEKYPGLSPYSYAGNNPALIIDINGDSLYAEHSYRRGFLGIYGTRVNERAVYRDGSWYEPGTNT